MSKRMKVLVSVLVATLLLTIGATASVMAQGEPTPTPEVSTKGRLATGVEPQIELSKFSGYVGDNMTAGLLAKVAEKLGVTEEELANAFKQAQQEIRQEAFIRSLDNAVAKGRITQQEADEIKEWWEQKPEVVGSNLFLRPFGFPSLRGRHMWGSHGGWCWPRLPGPAE